MTNEQTKTLEDARVLVKRNCGRGAMFNAQETQKIVKGLIGIINHAVPAEPLFEPEAMSEVPVVSKDVQVDGESLPTIGPPKRHRK
jgi:hypothetical protein